MICTLIVISGFFTASVLSQSNCSSYSSPSTLPFTTVADAQDWLDCVAKLHTDYWNGNVAYSTCCSAFDGATTEADGVSPTQNAASRQALFNMLRNKVTAGSVSSTCNVVDGGEYAGSGTYTVTANCNDLATINLPVLGDYAFSSSNERIFVFNTDGSIDSASLDSPKKLIQMVTSFVGQTQNSVPGGVVFEFGAYKLDVIDAIVLAAFAVLTAIFGVLLCFIMKRMSAMYHILMPRGNAKYDRVAVNDNDL